MRALEETGKVAIAKIVIRNKQHLAALRPSNGVLVLETMYYADEVRQPERVDGGGKLRKPEVEMAKSLVENLSASSTRRSTTTPTARSCSSCCARRPRASRCRSRPRKGGEVVDLMAALRESVERTQKKKPRRRKAR